MGAFFNDPDVELDEICWYSAMARAIAESRDNEELISIDEELKTHSCYVELHRKVNSTQNLCFIKCSMSIRYILFKQLPFKSHPVGSNGRNNIIAVTPMKFLPVTEFEKRQKSINRNQNLAIMSSAMKKIGLKLKLLNVVLSKALYLVSGGLE